MLTTLYDASKYWTCHTHVTPWFDQRQKHGQQLATVGGIDRLMWKATQEETTLATSWRARMGTSFPRGSKRRTLCGSSTLLRAGSAHLDTILIYCSYTYACSCFCRSIFVEHTQEVDVEGEEKFSKQRGAFPSQICFRHPHLGICCAQRWAVAIGARFSSLPYKQMEQTSTSPSTFAPAKVYQNTAEVTRTTPTHLASQDPHLILTLLISQIASHQSPRDVSTESRTSIM